MPITNLEHPRTGAPIADRDDPRGAEHLGAYSGCDGKPRRLIALPAMDAVLVVDEHPGRPHDRRLVAHLHPDEPAGNARLVAALYLADPGRRARAVSDDDWFAAPGDGTADPSGGAATTIGSTVAAFRLDVHRGELRWRRDGRPLSLRCVIGAVQAYEPAVAISERALAELPEGMCGRLLRNDLARLRRSPLVLNRGLRELLLARLEAGETLSLIAARCGRFINASRRHPDTSWLARRCGLMAPPGEAQPTPWVHTDVLALIAREGLSVAPREVELA